MSALFELSLTRRIGFDVRYEQLLAPQTIGQEDDESPSSLVERQRQRVGAA